MSTPRKLVHILWISDIGGGELFALELIRALKRAHSSGEVEQQLFYLGPGGPLREAIESLGVPTRQFQKTTRLGPVTLWRLTRALRRAQPDVVQLHGEAGVYWGLTASLLARVLTRAPRAKAPRGLTKSPKTISLIYEYGTNKRTKWAAMRRLLPKADRVLYGSEAVLRWHLERLPELESRSFLGYCGIDTRPFRRVAEERAARRPERPEAEVRRPVRLVTVGRLVEAKGHAVLLEAVRILTDRGVPAHAKVVGYGERREALEAQARELGIEAHVEFAGRIWPITHVLAESDLYVFPSLNEVQGLAPIEALAAGVPVISSAVGGLPEMLTDGEDSLLVPPGDPEALADAIERLWGDPELRARFIERGAQTALDYDIETIAEGFLEHYRELTAEEESRP